MKEDMPEDQETNRYEYRAGDRVERFAYLGALLAAAAGGAAVGVVLRIAEEMVR